MGRRPKKRETKKRARALFDWGGDSPGGFLRKGRACERSIIEMPAARWGMATGAAPLKAGTEATRESCRAHDAHDAHTRLSHSAAERGLAAIQHGRATVRGDQKGRNGARHGLHVPGPRAGHVPREQACSPPPWMHMKRHPAPLGRPRQKPGSAEAAAADSAEAEAAEAEAAAAEAAASEQAVRGLTIAIGQK